MNRILVLTFIIACSTAPIAQADNLLVINGYRDVVDARDQLGYSVFGWSGNNLTTQSSGFSYNTEFGVSASQIVELSLAGVPAFDPRLARLEVQGQIEFTDNDPLFEYLRIGNRLLNIVGLWGEAVDSYDPKSSGFPDYHDSGRPLFVPFVLPLINVEPYIVQNPNTGARQLDMPVDYFDGDGFVNFHGGRLLSYRLYLLPQITNCQPYHVFFTGAGTPPWNRLDTSKTLVKEGIGPSRLTYDNLINSAHGITGIVFDIQSLPDAANMSIQDFEFQMSPTGAFDEEANPPFEWQSAPAPSSMSVTAGSPARILILWQAGAIMNRWLRITVLANAVTGLLEPEVYYLGHLLGETTGPQNGAFTVSFADITPIRTEVGQTVDASNIKDIDKNGTVSFADISAMRGNVGAQLRQVTIP